jgi:hypothetical protein
MPKSSLQFSFDHTSPTAFAWAKSEAAKLLTSIADREQVRSIIARAFSENMTPSSAASFIRSVVGLTGPQTTALLNLRSLLTPNSPTYAGDGALVYAGNTRIRIPEDGFDDDMIDQRVEEYGDRLLNQRARMIARTELLGASNAGTQEAWQQAVDDGLLTGGEMREWLYHAVPDKHGKLCEVCQSMDGQRVALDEPFITPDGEEKMNPPAHPNCECGQGLVTEAERQREVQSEGDQTDEVPVAEELAARLARIREDFPSGVTQDEWVEELVREQRELGGPGSGFFGHAGRPGEQGGSTSENESSSGLTFSSDVQTNTKAYDAFLAKATESYDFREHIAVSNYTGSGYRQINMALRRDLPLSNLSDIDRQDLAALDQIAQRTYLADDITVYRGGYTGVPDVGSTLRDKGFVSTSFDPEVTITRSVLAGAAEMKDALLWKINVPRGSHVILPLRGGEHEVILPRGSKFQVTKVEGSTVYARLVK